MNQETKMDTIIIRCTSVEKEVLKNKAKTKGVSLSNYILYDKLTEMNINNIAYTPEYRQWMETLSKVAYNLHEKYGTNDDTKTLTDGMKYLWQFLNS